MYLGNSIKDLEFRPFFSAAARFSPFNFSLHGFFFFQYIRQNKDYVWPNILIHAKNVFPVFPICSHLGIPSYFFTISSENVLFTDKMGVIKLFTKQQQNYSIWLFNDNSGSNISKSFSNTMMK